MGVSRGLTNSPLDCWFWHISGLRAARTAGGWPPKRLSAGRCARRMCPGRAAVATPAFYPASRRRKLHIPQLLIADQVTAGTQTYKILGSGETIVTAANSAGRFASHLVGFSHRRTSFFEKTFLPFPNGVAV